MSCGYRLQISQERLHQIKNVLMKNMHLSIFEQIQAQAQSSINTAHLFIANRAASML